MSLKKLGLIFIIVGIFGVVASFAIDYIGLGKAGVQAAQLLGIQIGVVVAMIGLGLRLKQSDEEIQVGALMRKIGEWINNLPVIVWVLVGFFVIYAIFFVFPVFLNPDHRIQYFTRYIPEIAPIGRDLAYNTNSIRVWLSGEGLYDVENHFYPPLYAVIFAPFLLLQYPATYYLMTALTIGSLIASLFVFPVLTNGRGILPLAVFFFITTAFSYGMQFELERGQFNLLAFALCLLAIYLYHHHESFRHLAYLLFSVAVQIKIYPIVFILMFIKDWRDWKNNAFRFLWLGLFNLALLFVLGYKVFADFIKTLPILTNATWPRPYNHSLKAFTDALADSSLGAVPAWLGENASMIGWLLYILFFACLFAIAAKAYRLREQRINPDLFLVCTIGALILTSVSIDYKLPLLAPPLLLSLSQRKMTAKGLRGLFVILLVIITSSAYSLTLISFIYRPGYLAYSFPMLMTIMVTTTLLHFLDENRDENLSLGESNENEKKALRA